MADRTLYDILEVSRSASRETLRTAYDRLSEKFDPERPENRADDRAKLELVAVKDAFLTLGNAAKRAAYDNRLDAQYEPAPPFWSFSKVALVVALLLAGAVYYNRHKTEQARIAAEAQVQIAKEKKAEQEARAEAEAELARQAHLRAVSAATDARLKREQENSLRQFTAEQSAQHRNAERQAQMQEARDRSAKQRTELQQRREEQQATMAAQQQIAREKAALCQMERQRYGQAISCP